MNNTKDIFRGVGVEVDILNPENFLKVKETLTRIGIASIKESTKTLYQSCHILHKKDPSTQKSRYAIVHFKEMFLLDGKPSSMDEKDTLRRDAIVNLLGEWGLIKALEETLENSKQEKISLKIISHGDKASWNLVSKYQIGVKH